MSAVVVMADYQGLAIPFTGEGWFNATVAASRWAKLPNEWLRLATTKRYIRALNRKYGKFPHLKTQRGKEGGGTWLHPRLAVSFARWLDDDFAVWCDAQIEHLIHDKTTLPSGLLARRLDFEGTKAQSEHKGRLGSKLMNERRSEKPALEQQNAVWKLRMEPGLFASTELVH